MTPQRKKHIKILTERFNHSIEYELDIIKLKSPVNIIIIYQQTKNSTFLEYNTNSGKVKHELTDEDFIDILIEILYRNTPETVAFKTSDLLDIQTYLNEEGRNAEKEIVILKKERILGKPANRQLYGNRIKAESYNGVIILTDDLMWKRSNIIDHEDM